jgi:hypothetical protein
MKKLVISITFLSIFFSGNLLAQTDYNTTTNPANTTNTSATQTNNDTSYIVNQTSSWQNVPIIVDSTTNHYQVNGTPPANNSNYYYSFSENYRCFTTKIKNVKLKPVIFHLGDITNANNGTNNSNTTMVNTGTSGTAGTTSTTGTAGTGTTSTTGTAGTNAKNSQQPLYCYPEQ